MLQRIFYFGSVVALVLIFSCNHVSTNERNEIDASNVSKNKFEGLSHYDIKQLADSLYDHNNYKAAILYLDTLINMDSLNGEYYFKRGYSNGMLLKRDDAIKDYEKSIKLNHRVDAAYFNAGINCSFDNDSLALKYFKKCLEISPNFPNVKTEIMECEIRLREMRESLQMKG